MRKQTLRVPLRYIKWCLWWCFNYESFMQINTPICFQSFCLIHWWIQQTGVSSGFFSQLSTQKSNLIIFGHIIMDVEEKYMELRNASIWLRTDTVTYAVWTKWKRAERYDFPNSTMLMGMVVETNSNTYLWVGWQRMCFTHMVSV